MNSRSLSLSLVLVSAAACTAPAPPPEFNAADPSLTCPAGSIGWDFSTGGNTDDVKVQEHSSELRIVEATVNEGCGASPGNRTESFAKTCNGLTECTRMVVLQTETDPTPGCLTPSARIKYQCGVEATVYEEVLPGFGEVRLRCGAKLTILSASAGKNCESSNVGNATAGVVTACNGLRSCSLPRGLDGLISRRLELVGCQRSQTEPDAEITFSCGSDPTVRRATQSELNGRMQFGCPTRPAPSTVAMRVTSARFGDLNLTAKFQAACDGRTSCSRALFLPGEIDPAPGRSREFRVEYDCGAGGRDEPLEGVSSTNKTLTLRCGQPITVTSVALGKACNPTESAKQTELAERFQQCTGRGRCVVGGVNELWWMRDCTAAQTGFEVTYTCGSASEPRVATAPRAGPVELWCPAVAAPAPASGIRIIEASRGLGCSGAPVARVRNNLYANAVACAGQSSCSVSTALRAGEPDPCRTPDVKVSYRCGDDEAVRTIEGAAATLGASVRLSCEPAVTVVSASWGGCEAATGNATTALAQQCTGQLGQCAFSVTGLGVSTPSASCGSAFSASWRCGPDPTVKTATLAAGTSSGMLTCPVPATPYVRKACVPERCTGKQRRDENLACASDLTKPVLAAPTRWSLRSSEANPTLLQQNRPLSLTVSTVFAQALPTTLPFDTEIAQATIYAVDRFLPRGGGEAVEGFRCVVANPGLRRPQMTAVVPRVDATAVAAGTVLVGNANTFVVPESCFGANAPSWKDALRRYQTLTGQTITEADFRAAFTLDTSELRVAFDPQGRTVALRTSGTTEATAPVPNPIGFFYTPALSWVDFKGFYDQARLPQLDRSVRVDDAELAQRNVVSFRASTHLTIAAQRATLRKAEVEVDLYDATRLPLVELDFDWLMAGDAPGRNPYSPVRPLTPHVKTTAELNLGATVEIQTREAVDAFGEQAWFDAMTVGRVQGTPLGLGQPTGTTTRVMASFTDALRSRIVTLKTSSNNGWMATANEPMREFKVRVCLDMDTVLRFPGADLVGLGLSTARGDETFSVSLGDLQQFPRCVVSNQVLVVKRSLEEKLLPHDHDSADTQVGNSLDQGSADVNNETDMGNVGSCVRRCTVTADCGAGQTCQGGVCQGGTTLRCTSETSDSSGGSGVFGASMLRTSSKTTLDDGTTSGGSATSTATAELLGFQILQKSESQSWTTPGAHADFTISPNWDLVIAAARDGIRTASQAALLQPFVSAKRWDRGRQGLGVGLGRSFYLFIGPVPVIAEVSVTAGFGISLAFGFDLRSDYPCIGTQACYRLHTERRSLADANQICQDAGGQLAELSTATALSATRAAIPDTTQEYWIGGQQAVLWPQPSCATNRAACVGQSTTRYRWIKSNRTFAEQRATSSTLLNVASYASAFGGTSSQLAGLSPRVPNLGGVAFRKAASASSDALLSRSQTDTKPFVCEFEPASSARTSSWSAGIVLNAAAGASFSLCVPHSSIGVCLNAGLNFIDAELNFTFERSNTRRWNQQGLLLAQEGTDAFSITAGIGFLTGAISVEIKLLFFSIGYDLVRFNGVKRFDWQLYRHEFPTSQQ